MVRPGGTATIFPRSSGGRPVMMGASGMAIPSAFDGGFTARNGGGAAGAPAATGRDTGAVSAADESIRRRMPRNRPANFDLTMFDMTFVF